MKTRASVHGACAPLAQGVLPVSCFLRMLRGILTPVVRRHRGDRGVGRHDGFKPCTRGLRHAGYHGGIMCWICWAHISLN